MLFGADKSKDVEQAQCNKSVDGDLLSYAARFSLLRVYNLPLRNQELGGACLHESGRQERRWRFKILEYGAQVPQREKVTLKILELLQSVEMIMT